MYDELVTFVVLILRSIKYANVYTFILKIKSFFGSGLIIYFSKIDARENLNHLKSSKQISQKNIINISCQKYEFSDSHRFINYLKSLLSFHYLCNSITILINWYQLPYNIWIITIYYYHPLFLFNCFFLYLFNYTNKLYEYTY